MKFHWLEWPATIYSTASSLITYIAFIVLLRWPDFR